MPTLCTAGRRALSLSLVRSALPGRGDELLPERKLCHGPIDSISLPLWRHWTGGSTGGSVESFPFNISLFFSPLGQSWRSRYECAYICQPQQYLTTCMMCAIVLESPATVVLRLFSKCSRWVVLRWKSPPPTLCSVCELCEARDDERHMGPRRVVTK